MMKKSLPLFVLFFLALFASSQAFAEDSPELYVPEVLKPWTRWVLDRDPNRLCPMVHSERECIWSGSLQLSVKESGGEFHQTVSLAREGKVNIPGGQEISPIDVRVSEKGSERAVPVLIAEGHPVVLLPAGRHQLLGRFIWKSLPQSMQLPPDIGLVSLTFAGASVAHPRVNENGELWLHDAQADAGEAEEDSLRISVSRKLSDGVPFRLATQLELRVGGKAREVDLGKILPADFLPVRTEGELIHAFDQEGRLKVQVRPGVHALLIEAVRSEPPSELQIPTSKLAEWPLDEVWAWEADESLRSVTVSGVPGIDPQRTTLPADWKRLPAYAMTREGKLQLEELRRGEQELPPNQLGLHRRFWLDLDGGGLTVEDTLSGKMFQEWRLNMNAPTQLSRVEVSGEAQLITQDPRTTSAKAGVELRSPDISLHAISRIEGTQKIFPAVSWDHDVSSLSAELVLPPGWQVIEIFGVDNSPGTWLSTWSLWDLFFLFLLAIVVYRLKSFPLAVVTFLGLGLSHEIPGSPHYVWLHVIAASALLSAVPAGRAKTFAQWYLAGACSLIALILLSFALDQIRSGLFPQLGSHPLVTQSTLISVLAGALIAATVIVGILMGIGSLVYLFTGQFKKFFRALLIVGGCFLVFGLLMSFSIGGGAAYRSAEYATGGSTASYSRQATFDDSFQSLNEPGAIAPPVEQMEQQSSSGSVVDLKKAYGGRLLGNSVARQKLLQTDQKAVVQTGVGIPSWQWRQWTLGWNGPVERGRTIELLLISPNLNLVLSIVRILLFLVLLISFAKDAFAGIRHTAEKFPLGTVSSLVLFVALQMTTLPLARADSPEQGMPSESLLKELEGKLKENVCQADCLTTNFLHLSLQESPTQVALTVEATVSSDGPSAWPVPGPLSEFAASAVLVDGAASEELRRDEAGLLWVRVGSGVHKIRVEGVFVRRNSATLQFGIIPQHVELDAKGWSVDGLSNTGSVGESLQILRQGDVQEKKEDQLENQAESPLPDWYRVTRELTLGQPWMVTTTVQRFGSPERAQLMKLPILPGESVTEENIKVEAGNAQVSFPRGEASVSWTSTFREEAHFELLAPKGNNITEEWRLRCASIWRCAYEGIKPTHTLEGAEYLVDWRPWPGEKIGVSVSKPLGVDGLTETVHQAELRWDPGSGLLRAQLTLSLRSSQGGFRKISLPEGALVQQVLMSGKATNLMPKGRMLEVPVQPGDQQIVVHWQQPWEASFVSTLPSVDIGSNAFNVSVTSSVPQKRWLLGARGPAWGPAVLFWGGLLMVLGFGLLVGRLRVPPLSTKEWILLGLGTATLHPAVLLVPVVWSLALEYRRSKPFAKPLWFNAAQVGLVLLSGLVMILLFASLYCGLIVDPDMGVQGEGSSTRFLRWYLDRSPSSLPTPSIIWLPMWVYRLFMLLWSTWLVLVVLRWIRWAWKCLSESGWWKKLEH